MFERLTKRNSEGKATIDFKALGTPFGNDTVYDVVDLHHIACDHLAAYEDTGLTPNEIEQMKTENDHLKAQLGKAINALEGARMKGENW